MQKMLTSITGILIGFLAITSCRGNPGHEDPSQETAILTTTTPVTPDIISRTVTETTIPFATSTPSTAVASTGTPATAFSCASHEGKLLSAVVESKDVRENPAVVLQTVLNQGASLSEVIDILKAAEIDNQPITLMSGDIDADQREDLAISIYDPVSRLMPPAGSLLIYHCVSTGYELIIQRETRPGFGGPHLWYFDDLNQDGKAELVLSEAQCGAHTCSEVFEILSWQNHGLVNRLQMGEGTLPFPNIQVTDLEGDGFAEVLIDSAGIGSVGAGPQRNQTFILSYAEDSESWKVTGELFDPPKYRIHALQDAERAYQQRDFTRAQNLYKRVVMDGSLEAWGDPENERTSLSAFAHFKLYLVAVQTGDSQLAEAEVAALMDQAGEHPVYQTYLEAAQLFEAHNGWIDPAAGCEAVRAVFLDADREEALSGLNNFGYGNPKFGAEDICPEF